MAHVTRPTYVRPLPPDAVLLDRAGKPHARFRHKGKTITCPLTEDGQGVLIEQPKWYAVWKDRHGKVRKRAGYTDKQATEQLAARLEREAARQAEGLEADKTQLARPVAEHLADYARSLRAKGDTEDHVALTVRRVETMLLGMGVASIGDITRSKAEAFLEGLRAGGEAPALPEGKDTFSPKEVRELLGVSQKAVSAAVLRHGLAASGQGRKRRFPRATVEALVDLRARGASLETLNHYVRAARAFTRWLADEDVGRLPTNPLAKLPIRNADIERRHNRRELSAEELGRLFDATRTSPTTFRGLDGEARYHLYLTAAGTGLRADGLASLTPAHFDLDGPVPFVVLSARRNKSKVRREVPLPPDVADALGRWIAGRPADASLWPGTWQPDAAEMLRADLARAGIPYCVDGPHGPEYADFHALRHSYITALGRAGVDLRTVQELAGHSSPVLTARYSHRRLHDLAGGVRALPTLARGPSDMSPHVVPHVVPHVATSGTARHGEAAPGIVSSTEVPEGKRRKSRKDKPPGTVRHQEAS